jgi:hypothetical protein
MKRLAVCLVIALGLFTAVASAHTLKLSRAKHANARLTQSLCTQDPNAKCYDWHSGPCQRVSRHRVDCHSTTWVHLSVDTRCDWENHWYIKKGSNRLHRHSSDVACVDA